MNKNFHVTYEVITPESAQIGEIADQGFEVQHGTLRDCANVLRFNCEPEVASDNCLVFDDGCDYRSGATRRMALHIPNRLTESSKNRVKRLFGVRA